MVSGDNQRDDEIDAREEEEGGDEVSIGLSADDVFVLFIFLFVFLHGGRSWILRTQNLRYPLFRTQI